MKIKILLLLITLSLTSKSKSITNEHVYEFGKGLLISNMIKQDPDRNCPTATKHTLRLLTLGSYLGYVYKTNTPEEARDVNTLCALAGVSVGTISDVGTMGFLFSAYLTWKLFNYFVPHK